jgi:O-antigen/teichoic acid export membrane protein
MSKWQHDTRLTLLSRIPFMLLGLLSVILLTRLLGPAGMGTYTYVFAALNLLLTIFGLQLDGSATYFLATTGADKPKVISTLMFFAIACYLLFCTILTGILFLTPGALVWFIPPDQPVLFFFTFLLIVFGLRHFSKIIQGILRGTYHFKIFNVYLLISQLIPVVLYATMLLISVTGWMDFQMIDYFRIILLAEILITLSAIGLLLTTKEFKISRDYRSLQQPILSYSLKNLAATIGHFLNKRLDVWFVQHLRGTIPLGHYGLATQITNFISEALIPFNQVLTPYITGTEAGSHKLMVGRIARINYFISFVAAIVLIFSAWFFIPFLFGRDFSPSIHAVQILSVGIIFISQRLVLTSYLKATNNLRYIVQSTWGGVFITILLDIILIPLYGIEGAAFATVIAYFVTALFLIYHTTRLLGMRVRELLFLKKEDLMWLFKR